VGARFDPLLAKIVAAGTDRAEAFARLERALDETLVLGLVTNLRFLRWLVREPAVLKGLIRTDTLDHIWPPDDWIERTALPDAAWTAGAALLGGTKDGRSLARPDAFGGAFRVNGPPMVRLASDDGTERSVAVPAAGAGATDAPGIVVDDSAFIDVGGRSVAFRLASPPDVDRAARAAAGHVRGSGPRTVAAPMPGSVVTVHVAVGDLVDGGAPLVTLEAMKMEHGVVATRLRWAARPTRRRSRRSRRSRSRSRGSSAR
jgi:acetyl-CoA/propionyl-CoA carboxylase biotin carboxyl carrier protein